MIGALTGKIFYKKNNAIVLMVNGTGYLVFIPQNLLARLKQNELITLFIHTHVREDALNLYGFTKSQELGMFELLLSVSGIGPKTAMLVIDRGVEQIGRAIISADISFFTSIPRLGKKNSQKIIIELKNKLGSTTDLNLLNEGGETQELIGALRQFGFTRNEILETIKKQPENVKTLEEKVRQSLKILGEK